MKLRDLLDAATPRPWEASEGFGESGMLEVCSCGISDGSAEVWVSAADCSDVEPREAVRIDAAAIVAVMNAADDFVALYEAARALADDYDAIRAALVASAQMLPNTARAALAATESDVCRAILDRLRPIVEGEQ